MAIALEWVAVNAQITHMRSCLVVKGPTLEALNLNLVFENHPKMVLKGILDLCFASLAVVNDLIVKDLVKKFGVIANHGVAFTQINFAHEFFEIFGKL